MLGGTLRGPARPRAPVAEGHREQARLGPRQGLGCAADSGADPAPGPEVEIASPGAGLIPYAEGSNFPFRFVVSIAPDESLPPCRRAAGALAPGCTGPRERFPRGPMQPPGRQFVRPCIECSYDRPRRLVWRKN